MVELLVAIVAKVAELLVAPIALPLGYLMKYRSNLENLKEAVEKLEDRRERVQFAVNSATRQGKVVEQYVIHLLDNMVLAIHEAETALELAYEQAEQQCCKVLCPNLKKRYKLCRKTKKTLMVISQLLKDGKYDTVLHRPALRCPPPQLTARSSILNAILEAIGDADVDIVRVYGMCGCGKTTLVKKVALEATDEKLFNVIIMVEASPTPIIRKIQGHIANALGLEFHEEIASGRARMLCERLKKETKVLFVG